MNLLNGKEINRAFKSEPGMVTIDEILLMDDVEKTLRKGLWEESGYMTANLPEEMGIVHDPSIAILRLPGFGGWTPAGMMPSTSLIVDVSRCEIGVTRFDPNGDLREQMTPFEEQGWTFDAPGTAGFICHENVGVDGMVPAYMVRPLHPKK